MKLKKSITQIIGASTLLVLCAGSAHAVNIVANPGFEAPSFGGAEEAGAGDGWSSFNNVFRIQGQPPIGPTGAHGGSVVLKAFGEAGVTQDFPVLPTDTVTGTAWVMNDSADAMGEGQIAAVNLEWLTDGAPNGIVSFGSNIGFDATEDQWFNVGVVDAGVPAGGTNGVRLVLITGPFAAGGGGGAPRFDDAFLEITAIPVPAAVWLFGSGLVGLIGVARRKKAA